MRNKISFDKKYQAPKSLKNAQRQVFHIACEGICTEPNYLQNLMKSLREDKLIASTSCLVIANHQHSDPCGVLSDLLNDKGHSFDKDDHNWIVIDRDEIESIRSSSAGHPEENYLFAIKQAKLKGIKVAWSNPCFELWILLHFQDRQTGLSRKEAQNQSLKYLIDNKILKETSNIEQLKNEKELYTKLNSYIEKAKVRADKLLKDNQDENPLINPCTSFVTLIQYIFPSKKYSKVELAVLNFINQGFSNDDIFMRTQVPIEKINELRNKG